MQGNKAKRIVISLIACATIISIRAISIVLIPVLDILSKRKVP